MPDVVHSEEPCVLAYSHWSARQCLHLPALHSWFSVYMGTDQSLAAVHSYRAVIFRKARNYEETTIDCEARRAVKLARFGVLTAQDA